MKDYEFSIRPNYEANIALGWLLAIPLVVYGMNQSTLPRVPFYIAIATFALFALWWTPPALTRRRRLKALEGVPLSFYTPRELEKKMEKHPGKVWLGTGFTWTNRHIQRVADITSMDVDEVLKKEAKKAEQGEDSPGVPWIHGVEDPKNYKPILIKEEIGTLMTLIVGTTGSGKTRMFETIVTQAVLRGECVITLDAKGDRDLRDTMQRACKIAGDPSRFMQVHLSDEENSVRLNPITSFNDPSEIAARITAINPEENAFTDTGFMVMNAIVHAMILNGKRPTLKNISYYLKGDVDGLIVLTIQHYCQRVSQKYPDFSKWKDEIDRRVRGRPRSPEELARIHIEFYREVVHPDYPSDTIIELLRLFEHDRAHMQKMIVSTSAVLSKLVSGSIGKLISPDPTDQTDTRPITDLRRVIDQKKVLYIGLDTLSNRVVGQAFGAILLAEIAALTGQIYNYGGEKKDGRTVYQPVNVLIDEAAETINEPFIQVLNKARGANIRAYVAVQTVSDFVARFKDEAHAMQVLGNLNTIIALRTTDPFSQEVISKRFIETKVRDIQRAHGSSVAGVNVFDHGGNVGERETTESVPLVTPALLGMLPNLEYIASLPGGRCVKGVIPILVEKVAKKAA